MSGPYQRAAFMLSAARINQLPPDHGREVAFVGRSNVGKSSALNALTSQRGLARTSKTPGRTQLINFFGMDPARRLVDLPGYGFAKVPEAVKRQWEVLLTKYLERRHSLRGVVVLIDIRHPFTDYDSQMLAWCAQSGVPAHVLLTKADKLSRGAANATLLAVRKELRTAFGAIAPRAGGEPEEITVQLFSALKKQGLDELRARLDTWFEFDAEV